MKYNSIEDRIVYDERFDEVLKKEFGDIATPELLSLVRAAVATHEHAFGRFGISREKYLEWMGKAWDAGEYQRRVYDCEIEGSVNNWVGVALGFGNSLSFWGEETGYVTKSNRS